MIDGPLSNLDFALISARSRCIATTARVASASRRRAPRWRRATRSAAPCPPARAWRRARRSTRSVTRTSNRAAPARRAAASVSESLLLLLSLSASPAHSRRSCFLPDIWSVVTDPLITDQLLSSSS